MLKLPWDGLWKSTARIWDWSFWQTARRISLLPFARERYWLGLLLRRRSKSARYSEWLLSEKDGPGQTVWIVKLQKRADGICDEHCLCSKLSMRRSKKPWWLRFTQDADDNLSFSEKVTDKTPIPPPDWEALISLVADEILAERSPARLLQVRARLYDLLSHCIPPTTILKV